MKRFIVMAALACLLASATAGAETVYKWTDKNGKVVFGKQPPPNVKSEQVEVNNKQLGGTLGAPGGGANGAAGGDGSAQEGQGPQMTPFGGSWRAKEAAEARSKGIPAPPKCPPFSPNPTCRPKGSSVPSSGPPPGPRAP